MKNYNISCVIVTYNRKTLLKRCLDAVNAQTFKPRTVYITDNASTDGTIEAVKEWRYYNRQRDGIEYKYILNSKNEGGAGGFYLGMKTAFEAENPDALWVMDDDGEPAPTCLEELQKYLGEYHYICPLVIADDDRECLAFCSSQHINAQVYIEKAVDGLLKGYGNPFNGILYSHELVTKVGYPKKELFIWGDEVNYEMRAQNLDYWKVGVVSAIHYHPVERLKYVEYKGNLIPVVTEDAKLYCFVRNKVYNRTRYEPAYLKNPLKRLYARILIIKSCIKGLNMSLDYLKAELGLDKRSVAYKAVLAGIFGYFNGHWKYFKNIK